jgi:hypothetical protein
LHNFGPINLWVSVGSANVFLFFCTSNIFLRVFTQMSDFQLNLPNIFRTLTNELYKNLMVWETNWLNFCKICYLRRELYFSRICIFATLIKRRDKDRNIRGMRSVRCKNKFPKLFLSILFLPPSFFLWNLLLRYFRIEMAKHQFYTFGFANMNTPIHDSKASLGKVKFEVFTHQVFKISNMQK